ncbi:CPXCG motif-containing cysteine-rich protein [Kaarinaea lacus]
MDKNTYMVESRAISCPYCGESFSTTIDMSAGSQRYIEDCYVCCRPIQFQVNVGYDGELMSIATLRDDE